jgi:hypothetical protein
MLVRLVIAALAALALAAPAAAAPTVPRGFYGLTYGGEIRDASAAKQTRSWGLMAKNGAQSARTAFSWSVMQPEAGGEFDFSQSDRLVADATARGIDLLPILTSTPLWARADMNDWWPREASAFAAFADALVRRYGRGGSFWEDHPDLPARPVRHWQLYNEPGRSRHYAPVLRAGYRAVKKADGKAKVVLAGLTGTPHGTPWSILRNQYEKHGIRRWFDIAALHMYTGEPENVLEGVKRFRAVMRGHGDGRKPLWLTEFGITASKGRTEAPRSQRTLRTTDRGMAAWLTRAYAVLAADRRRADVGLGRAYWYTWASSYERGTGIFSFAGLNRFANGRLEAMPALDAYRRSARRHRAG